MRYAFVMGSNGPADHSPLRFANTDAKAMQYALAGRRCRFEVITPETGESIWKIFQKLYEVAENCRTEDTFICYFAGHGILDKGALYLLWDNTRLEQLLTTSLPALNILQAFKYCKADNKLLILDCCHAGAIVNMSGFRSAVGVPVEEINWNLMDSKTKEEKLSFTQSLITRVIGRKQQVPEINITPENHLVLMASERFENARELEELKGGFLTHNICTALGEQFYQADLDKDNHLSIHDLKLWLEQKASEHNRLSPKKKVPYPHLFGKQKGNFYFTPHPDTWKPYEIPWVDGTTLVVLPALLDSDTAFCIGKHPITNDQYGKFAKSTGHDSPKGEHYTEKKWQGPFSPWIEEKFKDPQKPVVCVSLFDAINYCKWINQQASSTKMSLDQFLKVRLPIVNEWDFAAFGTEFPSTRPDSWLDQIQDLHHNSWLNQTQDLHHKSSSPSPIDDTGTRINVRGVSDMFGNVWEWCLADVSRIATISANMYMAEFRGGSFHDDLRVVKPFASTTDFLMRHSDLGFRIAATIPLKRLPSEVQLRLSEISYFLTPAVVHSRFD